MVKLILHENTALVCDSFHTLSNNSLCFGVKLRKVNEAFVLMALVHEILGYQTHGATGFWATEKKDEHTANKNKTCLIKWDLKFPPVLKRIVCFIQKKTYFVK